MMRLFQLLIFGHVHHWTVIKEATVDWNDGAQSFMYVCQCKGCGKIKKFSVKP